MLGVIFLIVLALVWSVFAIFKDMKTREVPNWLNFSLIIFALGIRFFYSFFESDNFNFFYQGLIGFGIFFVIGNLFYYGRIFAGGDAKLMIAYGAVLPFFSDFFSNVRFFVLFIFLFLISGAFYGLVVSIIMMVRHFSEFKKEFVKRVCIKRYLVFFVFFMALIFILLSFFWEFFLIFGLIIFILPFFYFFAKAIDEACMVRRIKTSFLREGDWLYKDIKVGKDKIKASWEGLSLKDIKRIQTKRDYVYIREGIPFTPVFLIAFGILIYLWKYDLLGFFGFF